MYYIGRDTILGKFVVNVMNLKLFRGSDPDAMDLRAFLDFAVPRTQSIIITDPGDNHPVGGSSGLILESDGWAILLGARHSYAEDEQRWDEGGLEANLYLGRNHDGGSSLLPIVPSEYCQKRGWNANEDDDPYESIDLFSYVLQRKTVPTYYLNNDIGEEVVCERKNFFLDEIASADCDSIYGCYGEPWVLNQSQKVLDLSRTAVVDMRLHSRNDWRLEFHIDMDPDLWEAERIRGLSGSPIVSSEHRLVGVATAVSRSEPFLYGIDLNCLLSFVKVTEFGEDLR